MNFVDRFWRDKDGQLVIIQPPNLPIVGWLVFMVAAHFASGGSLKNGLQFLADGFLFTWAYLEITSGNSYFRRLFGIVVIVAIVAAHFS